MRKHPKVSALLAGIFNQRPSQPRYVFIRVIEIVLQHIRTHWYYNSSLNDEELTWISHSFEDVHDTAPLAKDKDRYIFCFSKLHKSWRECQAPPALTCFSFGEEKAMEGVQSWKAIDFNSIRPHNAVISCTISGWLIKTLQQAGINTDLFKAHSTVLLQVEKPVCMMCL